MEEHDTALDTETRGRGDTEKSISFYSSKLGLSFTRHFVRPFFHQTLSVGPQRKLCSTGHQFSRVLSSSVSKKKAGETPSFL